MPQLDAEDYHELSLAVGRIAEALRLVIEEHGAEAGAYRQRLMIAHRHLYWFQEDMARLEEAARVREVDEEMQRVGAQGDTHA